MGYLLFTPTSLFLLPAPYPVHFKGKKIGILSSTIPKPYHGSVGVLHPTLFFF